MESFWKEKNFTCAEATDEAISNSRLIVTLWIKIEVNRLIVEGY